MLNQKRKSLLYEYKEVPYSDDLTQLGKLVSNPNYHKLAQLLGLQINGDDANMLPLAYLELALPQPSTSLFATKLAALAKSAQKSAQVSMINKLVRLTKAKMSCFLCKDTVSDGVMKQIVADFSDNSEVSGKSELEEVRKSL